MTEKQMQTWFRDYIKSHPPKQTEVYELKIVRDNRLPFNAVKEHQVEALLQAESGGFFYKIPDPPVFKESTMFFNLKRPFDCMMLVNPKAFVVVWFYKPRMPKTYIKIPIQVFLEEMKISDRKSLTEARALEIGEQLFVT